MLSTPSITSSAPKVLAKFEIEFIMAIYLLLGISDIKSFGIFIWSKGIFNTLFIDEYPFPKSSIDILNPYFLSLIISFIAFPLTSKSEFSKISKVIFSGLRL